MKHIFFGVFFILLIQSCLVVNADVLYMKDGREIVAENCQIKGNTMWYDAELNGTVGRLGVNIDDIIKIKKAESLAETGKVVVVYGRMTCGWTVKYLDDLKSERITAVFRSIDRQSTADKVHKKMKSAGMRTSSYNLPVIQVGSQLYIRPDLKELVQLAKQYQ